MAVGLLSLLLVLFQLGPARCRRCGGHVDLLALRAMCRVTAHRCRDIVDGEADRGVGYPRRRERGSQRRGLAHDVRWA